MLSSLRTVSPAVCGLACFVSVTTGVVCARSLHANSSGFLSCAITCLFGLLAALSVAVHLVSSDFIHACAAIPCVSPSTSLPDRGAPSTFSALAVLRTVPSAIVRVLTCDPRLLCFSCVQTKGTFSFGRRHQHTHTLCVRCGRKSFHIQSGSCSSCGYPRAKMRRCQPAHHTRHVQSGSRFFLR